MIRVGIIGGSGYTGGELLRLLVQHPEADVTIVTSRALDGTQVADVHRHLKGFYDLRFVNAEAKSVAKAADVVFLAVPHGAAMGLVPDLIGEVRIIDLSADYRPVSYTHLRAHETDSYLVCRLLLEKKKTRHKTT